MRVESRSFFAGRCYDRVVMSEEPDRVAMVSDLNALEARLDAKLDAKLQAHHDDMRRHFDIMVERVEDAVKIVAEVNAHHAVVLDNHERRLKTIERASWLTRKIVSRGCQTCSAKRIRYARS